MLRFLTGAGPIRMPPKCTATVHCGTELSHFRLPLYKQNRRFEMPMVKYDPSVRESWDIVVDFLKHFISVKTTALYSTFSAYTIRTVYNLIL